MDFEKIFNERLQKINLTEVSQKAKVEGWFEGYRTALADMYKIIVECISSEEDKKPADSTQIKRRKGASSEEKHDENN